MEVAYTDTGSSATHRDTAYVYGGLPHKGDYMDSPQYQTQNPNIGTSQQHWARAHLCSARPNHMRAQTAKTSTYAVGVEHATDQSHRYMYPKSAVARNYH